MPSALAMISAVRTGPDAVGRILDTADLPALAVALAALIPDDRTISTLQHWYHRHRRLTSTFTWRPAPVDRKPTDRALQLCGTHAAYARHKYYCELPCEACTLAERIYQNARPRDRRKAA